MKSLRIILIDNNKNFLSTAVRYLKTDPSLEIIGSALSAEEGIEKIKLLKPDLVLMDLSMPGLGGFKATKIIKSFNNPPYIIVLTLHDTIECRNKAKFLGADGFVSKSEFVTELIPIIKEIFDDNAKIDFEFKMHF